MCLSRVYKGKKEKTELAKLPNMITCWKVVQRQGNQHGSRYMPEFYNGLSSFLVGWNKTEPLRKKCFQYTIAFHAFRTKKGAEKWVAGGWPFLHIIKCKTRKKDIVAIGEQRSHLCLVTKRIWMPKPKSKAGK